MYAILTYLFLSMTALSISKRDPEKKPVFSPSKMYDTILFVRIRIINR